MMQLSSGYAGKMLGLLRLLLPALLPSWRFFKSVQPSPRIEWRALGDQNWQEFRPRPASLPVSQYVTRLFWNPDWNEMLFLVTLSERMIAEPSQHCLNEIRSRLAARAGLNADGLEFRLIFVHRTARGIQRDILFQSAKTL